MKTINDFDNILNENFNGWRPNRLMCLDTPYSKSKPIAYIKNKPKKWTVAQHEATFNDEYLIDQLSRVVEDNCNIACIPVIGKYWILDIDSGKTSAEITNEKQMQDFDLLLKMALAHSEHIVKTPNGYHFYLPPSAIITKTHHLCCVDIQYSDVYCVAPLSQVKKNGTIANYEVLKWNQRSPKKCGIINSALNTALDRYIKYAVEIPSRLIEKIVDNKIIQQIVSLDSDSDDAVTQDALPDPINEAQAEANPIFRLLQHFGRSPLSESEHHELLASMVSNYSDWRLLAFRLKSAMALWGPDTFSAFCYISKCNKKYYETYDGVTGDAACQLVWDSQTASDDKVKYFNIVKNQIMTKDKWYLSSIECVNKFSEDNLISCMIANFVKTKIRACHDGNDCNYYKINPKTILWELQLGGKDSIVTKITKIFLELRTKLCDNFYPVIIKFDVDLLEVTKPMSIEAMFAKQFKKLDCENLSVANQQKFQQFKLRKLLYSPTHTLEKSQNFSSVFKFLQNEIIDNEFINNKDKIPYLIPLSDAYCINLKTGATIARIPEHYFTTTIPCTCRQYLDAKMSECEWFNDNYIKVICAGDDEVTAYAQKVLGSALVGEQTSHIFTMIIGAGRNGKSFLLSLLKKILGQLFHSLPVNFWCKDKSTKKHNTASPDDADLEGKRFVCQDELGDDTTLDTTKMRQHSGASEITCRGLYKSNRTFTPSYTAIMCSNNLPSIDVINHAVMERLRIWTMEMTFFEQGHKDYNANNPLHAIGDPDINTKVLTTYIGSCINWLVVGAVRYYSEGMAIQPTSWLESQKNYVEAKHLISRFCSDCLDKDASASIDINNLDKFYKKWIISPKFEAQTFDALKKGSEYYLTKNALKEKFSDLKMTLKNTTTSDNRRIAVLVGYRLKRCCEIEDDEEAEDTL